MGSVLESLLLEVCFLLRGRGGPRSETDEEDSTVFLSSNKNGIPHLPLCTKHKTGCGWFPL